MASRKRRTKRDHRDELSETASSVSTGPLTLDLEHARAWGFTEKQLNTLWPKLRKLMTRACDVAQRRHPERYAVFLDGSKQVLFIGAIHNQEAWTDARIAKAGMRRLEERQRVVKHPFGCACDQCEHFRAKNGS